MKSSRPDCARVAADNDMDDFYISHALARDSEMGSHSGNVSASHSAMPCWSFIDKLGAIARGQSIPISGSFQAIHLSHSGA